MTATAGARASMAAAWAAMLAGIRAVQASFGPIMAITWVAMMNMLKAVTRAAGAGLNAAMVFLLDGMLKAAAIGARAITAIWELSILAWQGVLYSGRIMMGLAMTAMTAIVGVGSALMLGVWQTALAAMGLAVATGRPIIAAAMGSMMTFLGGVVSASSTAILGAWRWLMAAMATIMAAAQSVLGTAMIAVMSAVQRAVIAGRALILGAWRLVIVGIQALWATLPALLAAANGALRAAAAFSGMFVGNAFRLAYGIAMFKIRGLFPAIIGMFRALGTGIQAAMTGPIGAVVIAVVAVLVIFRKQIGQIVQNVINYFRNLPAGVAAAFAPLGQLWNSIVSLASKAFYALPQSVQGAMQSVVNVVSSAAQQVYKLFSYLNPFGHHSPSLVENVTAGMAEVNKQFGSVSKISGPIKKAYADIKAFGAATAGFLRGIDSAQRAQDRAKLGKIAPGALKAFDTLVKDVITLTNKLML